jgi:lysophospholipid acyltransferase (LPLAT)-like uncharacterized protein
VTAAIGTMDPRRRLVASVGGFVLDRLMQSTRIELIAGAEVEEAVVRARARAIYVLWHGRLLPCAYHYRNHGFGTMITRNRDGDYIAGTIERWGFRVIRGSSSRGGSTALRAVVRTLRSGTSVALTPDGPRGPRQKMKLGPVHAARLSGVPIVPVAAGATSAWYFGRWDRFLVPKPFTWIPIALGTPIEISTESTAEEVATVAELVERRLNELTGVVDDAANSRR